MTVATHPICQTPSAATPAASQQAPSSARPWIDAQHFGYGIALPADGHRYALVAANEPASGARQ